MGERSFLGPDRPLSVPPAKVEGPTGGVSGVSQPAGEVPAAPPFHGDVTGSPAGFLKFDDSKLRCELIDPEAHLGMVRVLTYGAVKYPPDNWRKGTEWRRYIAAAQRHLLAFQAGEDIDPESNLPHLDHAACCIHFLSSFQKSQTGIDDRFKTRGQA